MTGDPVSLLDPSAHETATMRPRAPTGPRPAGLYAYLMTPCDRSGNVDHGILRAYVEALIEAGIDGVTCLASTGEGPYLTETERFAVAETVGKAVGGKVKVNVGIGAVSTAQVLRFARHAQDAGATSVILDMQTYFPISFEAAHAHYEAVARAVDLPIRLYNIPVATRFDFTPDLIARMSSIRSIDSIKESSGDATRVRDIVSLCGERFSVFCGLHFLVLDAFRFGAVGWEAALHPLIARHCVDLYRTLAVERDFRKGEALYAALQPLFYFLKYYGVPQSIKAMSGWSGIDLGRPRAPLEPLSGVAALRLQEILAELGVR